ncbi:hypothetical protein GCM10018962_14490 [Dactylosporangium matsuzakiense]|uniref:Lsr2 dimerization domain-containing protein n=2 Tax=Dactylosporangium matsuzakiense TaxID=53360 RepID=A0A9W6NP61_9ACTN|nr:Lsr2 family protein [Dactylosporangium matsuzakiense]GLL04705.1 hypothetical protein GCM10017581_064520 [Dactylosporangium matsuzakiense]
MAKRTVEELVDDLDGTPASQTVRFGMDGALYKIDLSAANAKALREALAAFVAAATRLRPSPPMPYVAGRGRSTNRRPGDRRDRNRAIREGCDARLTSLTTRPVEAGHHRQVSRRAQEVTAAARAQHALPRRLSGRSHNRLLIGYFLAYPFADVTPRALAVRSAAPGICAVAGGC